MRHRWAALAATLFAVVVAVSACAGSTESGGPSGSPAPTIGPVTTPERAVAAVIANEPRLAGITARDPDLIGQSSWYEVVPASGVGAFLVSVRVGWGDCPAGCISEHTWRYAVLPDGTVEVQAEAGEPVPPDAWPSPGGSGTTGLAIHATAGPTCPVVTDPPDPSCVPRAVAGAVVVIRDEAGTEIARTTLDETGSAIVEVRAGGYVVEAQPVDGLMGTPEPKGATVIDGVETQVELAYDTGIR